MAIYNEITDIYNLNITVEKMRNNHLNNIIETDAKFIIPMYQRLYSWDKTNFDEFIETLNEGIDYNILEKSEKFFGQIIMHLNSNGDYEIVDGQQRLTTFMLLGAILYQCDELRPDAKKEIKSYLFINEDTNCMRFYHQKVNMEIINEYVFNNNVSRTSDEYLVDLYDQFMLNEITRKEYREKLNTHYKKKNTKFKKDHYGYIVEGFNYLYEWYVKLSDRDKMDLIRYIKKNLKFSVLTSNDFDMAYESFMSLNAKGRPLSDYDLIKSVFVGEIGVESTISMKWENFIEPLDITKKKIVEILDIMFKVEFLDLYKNETKDNLSIKHSELHKFILYLTKKENIEKEIIFDKFINYIEKYINIKDGNLDKELTNSIKTYNASAGCLIEMDYKPMLPVLFYSIKKYKLSSNNLEEIINICKFMPFIYVTIARECPIALHRLTMKFLESDEELEIKISQLKENFQNVLPTLNFAQELSENTKLNNHSRAKDLILLIEDQLGQNDKYNNQLEHIYPQKPKKNEWTEFKQKKSYLDLIGNHAIAPSVTNGEMSNKTYNEKLDIIKSNKNELKPYRLLNELPLAYTEFTPETVEKRGKILANQVIEKFIDMGLLKDNNV